MFFPKKKRGWHNLIIVLATDVYIESWLQFLYKQ